MQNEEEYISDKMKTLVSEGYSRPQAYMISKSMYQKMQQGGVYAQQSFNQAMGRVNQPQSLYNGSGNIITARNNQSNIWNPIPQVPNQTGVNSTTQTTTKHPFPKYNSSLENNSFDPSSIGDNPNYEPYPIDNRQAAKRDLGYTNYMRGDADLNNVIDEKDKVTEKKEPQYNYKYNLMNPYGGIDLDAALNYTGNAYGEGDTFGAIAGTGLSLLKGTRNFLTGYASGKENRRVKNEYLKERFDQNPNYEYLGGQQGGEYIQQGGKIKNSEYLTGQFIADEGQGSVNLENEEYVKRAEGNVQQVVGEPHLKNGKVAEGVNADLKPGDKVLSNYTKIPAKDIKELKERYQVSLKKGATFADAQKVIDRKLGIKKLTDELATDIEKFGKNNAVKDETAKRLNEMSITKNMESKKAKLDALKDSQSMIFEDLFSRQEVLPKLGDGKQLFDKNGKVVEGSEMEVAQEGGQYLEIAKKYGISPERAKELIQMQQGGEIPQEEQQAGGQEEQMQQIFEAVAQMLQKGMPPEQIAKQLVSMGVPPEAVAQIIEQVASQMQPQEGEQQMMAQQGGKVYAQENGNPWDAKTKYSAKVDGYVVEEDPIYEQDYLKDIEALQPYIKGKGHGAKMQDVEKTIAKHSWYFDTEEKKKKFKEAVVKPGAQQEIKDFQEAFNNETRKRAKEKGISDTEIERIIKEVGFVGDKATGLDGKFGAYTSSRPLLNFKKVDAAATPAKPVDTTVYPATEGDTAIIEDRTKNVMPWLPQKMFLSQSPLDPIAKEEINLPIQEYIKMTEEPMLAEQARQSRTDIARVEGMGLTPQQQEAMLAGNLASNQIAANDAIGRVSMGNADLQLKTDQFNLGQRSKEVVTNANLRQSYQDKVLAGKNNYERDYRNFLTDIYLNQNQKFKDISNIQLANASRDNYQFIPGQGVIFNDRKSTDFSTPELDRQIGLLTPAQTKVLQNELEANKTYDNNSLRKALIKARAS